MVKASDWSPEVKRVEAESEAGIVPFPMAPLTEPVTVKATAEEKTTDTVCATAAGERTTAERLEPPGLVLGVVASAELPSAPLVVPVTVKSVAVVNSTVSVSLAVAPVTLLIEPRPEVEAMLSRPEKSTGGELEAPVADAGEKTSWRFEVGPTT